jgi:hypothetical protein
MSYVVPGDFTNKWAIAKPFDGGNKLQAYIDHYEQKYLIDLLGAELYVLFVAGYANEDEIYEKLYEPFAFDSECENKPFISEGIEVMLKNLIYAHYQQEDLGVATGAGKVDLDPEGGRRSTDNESNTFAYYNQGIKTYKAIQQYIKENEVDYPEFKGVEKQLTWYF